MTYNALGPALDVWSIVVHLKATLSSRNIIMLILKARGLWHGAQKWLAQGHRAEIGRAGVWTEAVQLQSLQF